MRKLEIIYLGTAETEVNEGGLIIPLDKKQTMVVASIEENYERNCIVCEGKIDFSHYPTALSCWRWLCSSRTMDKSCKVP